MARPTIYRSRTSVTRECVCGTQIPAHGTVFGVTPIPRLAKGLFRGQAFCSPKCIRAFLLEAIEMVDALETHGSGSIVIDFPQLRHELAQTLALILVGGGR
jgi:hypothetical protein